MIVVDTSALAAILFVEAERDNFTAVIAASGSAYLSAPNALEFLMVAAGRHGEQGRSKAQEILDSPPLEIAAWEERHVSLAAEAFSRFGKKGRLGAGLNYGDCMAYALAKALDAPLLFKGNGFSKTDIVPAL